MSPSWVVLVGGRPAAAERETRGASRVGKPAEALSREAVPARAADRPSTEIATAMTVVWTTGIAARISAFCARRRLLAGSLDGGESN